MHQHSQRIAVLAAAACLLSALSLPVVAQTATTREAPTARPAAGTPAEPAKATAPQQPGAVAKQGVRIGMLIPHRTNPFWVNFAKSAEQAAKSLGITLKLVDYENREEKQIDTLQGLISSGVDGLIVIPHNTQMGPAILDLVEKNKLPLMIADRWPGVGPESGKYLAFIGVNDEELGYMIAAELLKQGCTKIVVNNGVRGHSGYQARTKGRARATSEHPEVKILREEWAMNVRADGTKTMEAWLTAMPGPEFDCLYGGNDDWAMGAWKVLQDRGVANKVKIAGLDAIPEVVEKLKTGAFAVSGGGHWYEGAITTVLMYDFINGVAPANKMTMIRDIVVTQATAAKFDEQFYKNPIQIDWKQRSRFHNPGAPTEFVIEMKP